MGTAGSEGETRKWGIRDHDAVPTTALWYDPTSWANPGRSSIPSQCKPTTSTPSATWVGGASGATYERFVEIRRPKDGELLAKVRTVWVMLDAKTLRPKRVTEELRMRFES
jgi:hypothetical protein